MLGRFQLYGYRRSVCGEVADVGPVDDLDGAVAAVESFGHQAADKSLQTHVGTGHTPAVADLDYLNVIYTNDAFSVDVYQLIIQHIFFKQNLAFAAGERTKVEYIRPHFGPVKPQLRYIPSRHKEIPPPVACDQADNR